jgi:hypothetical protein
VIWGWQVVFAVRGGDFKEFIRVGQRRSLLFRAVDNLAAGFDTWPDGVKAVLSPSPRRVAG